MNSSVKGGTRSALYQRPQVAEELFRALRKISYTEREIRDGVTENRKAARPFRRASEKRKREGERASSSATKVSCSSPEVRAEKDDLEVLESTRGRTRKGGEDSGGSGQII